ncbi:MAG TPA: DMT family transporter [Pseudolabrys sp.]|jgi:drug/metabolite transporter (DMT)-like permease
MTSTSPEKLGLALGFAGVLLFGGTLPATRIAIATLDPLFLSAARAGIAGCCGLLLLLVLRRPWPTHRLWREFALAGLCTIVGFPVFMALAMTQVPASHGGVVLGIVPLATVAAAALVTHERPSLGFWLASVAGAVIVFVFMVRHSGAHTIELGDLYLLGTVVSGAFGYALSGRLSLHRPGWEVISWQVAMVLPLSLLATFFLWPSSLATMPASAWGALAYVSLVSQFFAFFVFNAGMAMGGVARVGQLMLLQPFIIVALAVPVNGERFDPSTLFYAAAVVAAVLVGQRMRVKRR